MASIIPGLSRLRQSYEENADPRTKDWFLMSPPWVPIAIVVVYLYIVKCLGPRLMANRKPYKLDRIIQIYNVVQILLNIYLFSEASFFWRGLYSFKCEPVNYSSDPLPLKAASGTWLYYILKIIDLLDTLFFVLRKKQNQISFLHVFHHASMVLGCWLAAMFIAGGHVTFVGFLNSLVHIILYTHYLVTSLKLTKPWWRKYITQIQIIQFFAIFHHFVQLAWVPNCGFPIWPSFIFVPLNLTMTVLFANFYYNAYIKKKPTKSNVANEESCAAKKSTTGKSKAQ